MEPKLEKKYGLITAIAMVVGIVIGSGVFFKAEKILTATGGNLKQGILAWVIGGIIMISCAYTFSVMATRYQYVNGVVDYAEAAMGKKYAFYVGWFMAIIYYPTITSVLAWVSARFHNRRRMYDNRMSLPGCQLYTQCLISCPCR
jgi:basic amino acid/polyamine antiporter, APA family